VGITISKRQVDALTITSGPAEDGVRAPPPSSISVTKAAADYTTLIIVSVIVVAVVLISAILYLRRRKKTRAKTIDTSSPNTFRAPAS
jgi:hypothetical protein